METSDLQTAGLVTFGLILCVMWACWAGWIVISYMDDRYTKVFRRWQVAAWCVVTVLSLFFGVAALEASDRKHRCAYYNTCQESR